MVLKCVSERGGEREGGERERRVDNKNTQVRVLCCWDSRCKRKTRQGGQTNGRLGGGQTKSKSPQEIDWGQESM